MFLNDIKIAVISSKLLKGTATLDEFLNKGEPKEGKNYRFAIRLVACAYYYVSLAIFVVFLGWTPVISVYSENGQDTFACIPASYPEGYSANNSALDLPSFLGGDTDFAVVYNYGLPLANGLIGGWSAWPLQAPTGYYSFSTSSEGVLFAIYSSCEDPVTTDWKEKSTHISIVKDNSRKGYIAMDIEIVLPAGSAVDSDSALKQFCQLKIMTSPGKVECMLYFANFRQLYS